MHVQLGNKLDSALSEGGPMNRRERTTILIKDNTGLSSQLAGEIESKYSVEVLEDPAEGLVMIKMKETARKSQFFLGEVLVTQCKVILDTHPGLGIVQGHEPELSKELAIIDAAYRGDVPETRGWEELFQEAWEKIQKEDLWEAEKIAATKVNFSSMMEEDYL